MCRTYETKRGPFVRCCYRTGRPGHHIPGRLGEEVPATPSGWHVAKERHDRIGPRKLKQPRLCSECKRPMYLNTGCSVCERCL